MTMTVDEALQEARSEHTYDELREFGAEWTRCEEHIAAHGLLGSEVERLQKVVADQALTIGTLKDASGHLHAAFNSDGYLTEVGRIRAENTKLREEAQTSRLALDVALKEVERLKGSSRNLVAVCPDCNHGTADHDTVEGAAHCRYCGHPVDADENPEPGAAT